MLIVCNFHYIRCNVEYGLSYIISAKKLLKPQKKEASNGAEYNLVPTVIWLHGNYLRFKSIPFLAFVATVHSC